MPNIQEINAEVDDFTRLTSPGYHDQEELSLDRHCRRPLILHVTECLSTGVLSAIRLLCASLDSCFDFAILYGLRQETPADFEKDFPPSVKFIPWAVRSEMHPLAASTAIFQLVQAVRRLRPDLIHAHSSKAGALVRIIYPTGRLPVVYTPHCYAFQRTDQSRISNAVTWGIEWLLGRLNHITVAIGRAEFAQSQQVARRSAMIPNMIELPARSSLASLTGKPMPFPDALADLQGDQNVRTTIVSTGSIRPQKNFPLFCDVARELLLEPFDFVWVGSGEIPPGLDVPENVQITGWLAATALQQILSRADVFIHTSKWEGLSISVLEAISFGLPAVVTPLDANRELVTNCVNGFICSKAPEFVAALRLLGSEHTLLTNMGKMSKLRAEAYTTQRVAHIWSDLYRSRILSPNVSRGGGGIS
jgi:glycosyltransferase involved in cell wall biosynthesis